MNINTKTAMPPIFREQRFGVLMKHMAEEHANSSWFGDILITANTGTIMSQKCQICGRELVAAIAAEEAER